MSKFFSLDESIVECEEVTVSPDEPKMSIEDIPIADTDSDDVTTVPEKKPPVEPKKPVYKPGPSSSKLRKPINRAAPHSLKILMDKDPANKTPEIIKKDADVTCIDHIKKPPISTPKPSGPSVENAQSTKVPPDNTSSLKPLTTETTNKLFELIKPASLTKFSILEPASKSLVVQLLNIVKMANTRTDAQGPSTTIPSTYIITTKQDKKGDFIKKPMVMESVVIVHTITNLVKDIKSGVYQKVDNISVICGSPAIFFIKNVTVKNCDPNMNSIYVVTAENLLPHLFKLNTGQAASKLNTGQAASKLTTQRTLVKQIPPGLSKGINNSLQPELPHQNKQSERPASSTAPIPQDIFKPTDFTPTGSKTQASQPTTYNTSRLNSNLKSQIPATTSLAAGTKFSYTATTSKLQIFNKSGTAVGASRTKTTFVTSPANQPKPSSSNTSKFTPSPIQSQLNKAPFARVVPSAVPIPIASGSLTFTAPGSKSTSVLFSTTPKFQPFCPTGKQTYYSPSSPQMKRPGTSQVQHVPPTQAPISSPIVIPSTAIRSILQSQSAPVKSSPPPAPKYQPLVIASTSKSVRRPPSPEPEFIFRPIQANTFNTNLSKSPETLYPCSPIPSTSKETPSLKRKWEEEDEDEDDDDNDNIIVEYNPSREIDDREYIYEQEKEIEALEENILQKERDINNLKKKISYLKKRLSAVKSPHDMKTDEQLVEEILSKYIDTDGVQFFVGQMKVSGKTYTQFRWSEEDKLFALSLLYKNPMEYNILFQRYTLPSDKTLNKFVQRIKKAEMNDVASAE